MLAWHTWGTGARSLGGKFVKQLHGLLPTLPQGQGFPGLEVPVPSLVPVVAVSHRPLVTLTQGNYGRGDREVEEVEMKKQRPGPVTTQVIFSHPEHS